MLGMSPGAGCHPKLPRVDPGIQTGGPLIAREPVEDRALGHDSWSWLARHKKRFQAVGVIEVAMREDRGMHRRLRMFAQLRG
jgi:hypothetical protein